MKLSKLVKIRTEKKIKWLEKVEYKIEYLCVRVRLWLKKQIRKLKKKIFNIKYKYYERKHNYYLAKFAKYNRDKVFDNIYAMMSDLFSNLDYIAEPKYKVNKENDLSDVIIEQLNSVPNVNEYSVEDIKKALERAKEYESNRTNSDSVSI